MSDEQAVDGEVLKAGSVVIEDDDRALYGLAAAHFPEDKHRQERRGNAEIMYLEGETIISALNRLFVFGWEFVIKEQGINEDADEAWCLGEMTIWRRVTLTSRTLTHAGEVTTATTEQLLPIRRQQYGSQKLKRARSTNRILDIGFDMKGAETDCIKKCASLFGFGLYLWNKEERAIMADLIAQSKQGQGQRQLEDGQQEQGGQAPAQGGLRRASRPNRSQETDGQTPPQDGPSPLIINGLRMPDAFQQPFALEVREAQTACRAQGCAEVIDPNGRYQVGGEEKPGGYIIKRSREEAGCVLCSAHTAQWYRAKQATRQSA